LPKNFSPEEKKVLSGVSSDDITALMNCFPSVNRAVFVAAISLYALISPVLFAAAPTPSDASLEVTATNGAGVEKHLYTHDGAVSMLMVRPNQTVPVTLQFPSDKAGMPLAAIPLDGGTVNGGNWVVLPTGKLIFTFSPGAAPGRYRVMVRTPGEQHLLEFYVVDPNHDPRQRHH
jgi:hypothetical protein